MTVDAVRRICRSLPGVAEDVKWGNDLVFSVGGKMFAVIDLDPPHGLSFKCAPDVFAELGEREGIIPAPYLARAMWVREQELGAALGRREVTDLIGQSYALVVDTLPRARRPDGGPAPVGRSSSPARHSTAPAPREIATRQRGARPAGAGARKRRSGTVSEGFKALVLDNLDALGSLTAKSMFGGVGLYHHARFFGIIAADVLYLKVDDSNRRDYERRGMKPFKPFADRPGSLKYHAVPVDVVESPADLARWARKAIKVAVPRA